VGGDLGGEGGGGVVHQTFEPGIHGPGVRDGGRK
jgi:hypothetical protein